MPAPIQYQGKRTCWVCDSSATNACGSCKIAKYCSVECQKKDWFIHKRICGALARMPPVVPNTILGMLLPEVGENLEFIRVPVCRKVTNSGLYNDFLDVTSHIPEDRGRSVFDAVPVRKRRLKRTIQISYRDSFLNDGSKINSCVSKLTNGKNRLPWCGPIIVVEFENICLPNETYEDFRPENIVDVIDIFGAYRPFTFA